MAPSGFYRGSGRNAPTTVDFVDVAEVPNLSNSSYPMVAMSAGAWIERVRSGCRIFSGLIKFSGNPSFAFYGNCATEKSITTFGNRRFRVSVALHLRTG